LSVSWTNSVEIAGEGFNLGGVGVHVGHVEHSKRLLSSFVGRFVLLDSSVSRNINHLNCRNMGVCKAKALFGVRE